LSISRKRLEEIQNIPDEDIDTSDIPELGDLFWGTAKMVVPISKKAVSLRIKNRPYKHIRPKWLVNLETKVKWETERLK
jgi:hypothetical protein